MYAYYPEFKAVYVRDETIQEYRCITPKLYHDTDRLVINTQKQ